MSSSVVSRIEDGSRRLRIDELATVAAALSVAPMALLAHEGLGLIERKDDTDLISVAGVEISERYFSWWFTGGLPEGRPDLVEDAEHYRTYGPPHPLRVENLDNRWTNLIVRELLEADAAQDRGDNRAWRQHRRDLQTLLDAFLAVGDAAVAEERMRDEPGPTDESD